MENFAAIRCLNLIHPGHRAWNGPCSRRERGVVYKVNVLFLMAKHVIILEFISLNHLFVDCYSQLLSKKHFNIESGCEGSRTASWQHTNFAFQIEWSLPLLQIPLTCRGSKDLSIQTHLTRRPELFLTHQSVLPHLTCSIPVHWNAMPCHAQWATHDLFGQQTEGQTQSLA